MTHQEPNKNQEDVFTPPQKVALVHDWTIHMRGGEKVLDALAEIFPDATLYTLFYDRSKLSPRLQNLRIKASFLNWLPGIKKYYRWLLPIFPFAISTLRIDRDTTWVISSSHCVAKGIPIPPNALHVCYINTPMRYAWVAEDVYFRSHSKPMKWLIHQILTQLKKWDLRVNRAVDLFISNSENIRERLRRVYGCDSAVVHPPYEDSFYHATKTKEEYYFAISHFVPYKKIDIVIEAFNDLNRSLIVAGSGPLENTYKSLVSQPKIRFVGSVNDEELRDLYSGAKAVIFPAEEDFGIVPLEAQACGTPVIAFGKGGSLETVQSGLFFDEQTPEAIQKAVLEFENSHYTFSDIRGKISNFTRAEFIRKIKLTIQEASDKKNAKSSTS
jgi:glycosyltransferase involved in cell wall biosynthesis